jgi:hypothetical protein
MKPLQNKSKKKHHPSKREKGRTTQTLKRERERERERENQHPTRGMSHYGLAIYMKKYLKAKKEEELWKLNYISPCKNKNLSEKKSFKRKPKSFKIYYYNSIITNPKFQTQAKISSSSFKNRPSIKIDLLLLLLLPMGQNPLSYYTLLDWIT